MNENNIAIKVASIENLDKIGTVLSDRGDRVNSFLKGFIYIAKNDRTFQMGERLKACIVYKGAKSWQLGEVNLVQKEELTLVDINKFTETLKSNNER